METTVAETVTETSQQLAEYARITAHSSLAGAIFLGVLVGVVLAFIVAKGFDRFG